MKIQSNLGKNMIKTLFICLLSFGMLTACDNGNAPADGKIQKELLFGSWVQPALGGSTNLMKGFTLNKDGSVQSINMTALDYTRWQYSIKKNELKLSFKSKGKPNSLTKHEAFQIEQLEKDKLTLIPKDSSGKLSDTKEIYTRRK